MSKKLLILAGVNAIVFVVALGAIFADEWMYIRAGRAATVWHDDALLRRSVEAAPLFAFLIINMLLMPRMRNAYFRATTAAVAAVIAYAAWYIAGLGGVMYLEMLGSSP